MNDFRKEIHSKLLLLGEDLRKVSISELNKKNDFEDRVIESDLLTFDYSKQIINQKVLEYLLQIPDLINLKESLDLLFKGEFKNPSEGRTVSHTLYRNKAIIDNSELILSERKKIQSFLAQKLSDHSLKNLICLSIGGSRLGTELLNEFQSLDGPMKIYFCSSYDLQELKDTLCGCQQNETLVFASSKSFETSEIIKNLNHVFPLLG